MNVLICVNRLDYAMGGVSVHILDLCKQYSKLSGIDRLIVCADGGEHIDTLRTIPKVEYYEIPFNSFGTSLEGVIKAYLSLWNCIKDKNIDIIHTHSQRIIPVAFMIKKLHRIPFVWTNHIDAIPGKRKMQMMCRVMHFPVISVSQELKNMMVEEYSCIPSRVYVVNNGVDLDRFKPLSEDEIQEIEKEYQINRNKTPYVICLLSRMCPVKGHNYLIDAVLKLKEKDKIKLIFAGHTYPQDIDYRDGLVNRCKTNNIDALFLEYSDPRKVFGISDVFVLPSLNEGFPLVLIEALAMGCSIIRSRTPGWQELLKWSIVIDKGSTDQLVDALETVIHNEFNKTITCDGMETVKTVFTKEMCAERTIEVYKKILLKD